MKIKAVRTISKMIMTQVNREVINFSTLNKGWKKIKAKKIIQKAMTLQKILRTLVS